MELRKHLDFRKVFVILYGVAFAIYIMMGLAPAEATNYEVSAEMAIPSIGLESDVTTLYLDEAGLETPETIVGSYTRARGKTLLIGHASTVFQDLDKVGVGDEIVYDYDKYVVVSTETVEKADVDMNKLLRAGERETLLLMTCAGTMLDGGDATHRLIITATR